ncbi:hypothetical protein C8054_06190 [Micromonospora sp. RP3T]|nr:hypothetical protein C8054_06190 [Micromonospora sp. RP3T]
MHGSAEPAPAWVFSALVAALTLGFPLLIGIATALSDQGDARLVSGLRATFVTGYVIGLCLVPVASLADAQGLHIDPLAVAGGFAVLIGVSAWFVRLPGSDRDAVTVEATTDAAPMRRRIVVVASLAVLMLIAADTLRLVYLPLHVVGDGIAPQWISVLFLACVLAELPILPLLGRLTDRHGSSKALIVICALGLTSFGMLAAGGGIAFLVASQIVYAPFAAGVQSVAMVHLGGIVRGGLSAGAGLFAAIMQLGALTGVAAPLLVPGYSGWIFLLPAGFCAMALLMIALASPAAGQNADARVAGP